MLPTAEATGEPILRELDPVVAGLVFDTYRAVLRFAGGERPDAGQLRAWEEDVLQSSLEAGLREPLAVILGELADPVRADRHALAWACLVTAGWALGHAAPDTAVAFAEAAALCAPESGRWALVFGRMLRSHGQMREAELWLRRAVRLGRAHCDWEPQVLGMSGLGMLAWKQGAMPRAWRWVERAHRVPRRPAPPNTGR